MRYLGGKTRLAPWILELIIKYRKNNQWYIEPFCGGCNVIDKVEGHRLAIDSNAYLIAMWKALQTGWKPPNFISEEQYQRIRQDPTKYKPHVVGFVGFCCSFGGKWFGGYARRKDKFRNYCSEGRNVVLRQIELMMEVKFYCGDSLAINNFDSPCLIYCDPPYANTTKYVTNFDNLRFWSWANALNSKGHTVLVSELSAPSDWECIFSQYKFNGTYGDQIEKVYAKTP